MEEAELNERMTEDKEFENIENFLTQQFFTAEYIDMENGNYVKVKYRKVEQYAFFMRFVHEWFHPCVVDQLKLKKLFNTNEIRIYPSNAKIGFSQAVNKKGNNFIYSFILPFISALPFYEFTPCKDCQKEISEILRTANSITISNKEYEYPVEFNMRYEYDDGSFETIIDRPPTAEEKRIGERWQRHEITQEEYEKLPVIQE